MNDNTKSKSFMLYKDWQMIFDALDTDAQRGELIMAVFDYAVTGQRPELEGMTKLAFTVIAAQLERDADKYNEVCKKRSENGKKGGRPAKSTAEKADNANGSPDKQTKAKKAHTDTDTETDTETDTDTERETDTETETLPAAAAAAPTPADKNRTYGEFGNVTLKNSDHRKLCEEYGQQTVSAYIDKMDDYLEQSGKSYKNCYAALKKWIREDMAKSPAETVSTADDNTSFDLDAWEELAMSGKLFDAPPHT